MSDARTSTRSSPFSRPVVGGPVPYRGRIGTLMWVLHRVTGVLILFFLFAHVIDTATIMWGPEVYNEVVELYKNTYVRIFFEVPLVGAVIFHAFNGVRIILIDLTTFGARRQRELAYGVFATTIALFVPAAFFMLRPIFVEG